MSQTALPAPDKQSLIEELTQEHRRLDAMVRELERRVGLSAAEQVDPSGHLHASPEYLRQLVRVLVDRAVARARERAG